MLLRLLAILLFIVLFSADSLSKADDVPQEFLVKAKYLLNIPLFTEMPSLLSSAGSFGICLIGDTPLESVLLSSKGKFVKNLPIKIRRVEELKQLDSCQMLFIGSSERYRLQMLLTMAHSRGILTVSDMHDFVRLGGIIGLVTVDNRVTFDMNLSTANKASISFSSHLLKLAHNIVN